MVQTSPKAMTVEEYLNFDGDTERPYELVAGQLVEMPPEDRDNSYISIRLLLEFARFIPVDHLCHKDTEIQVTGPMAQFRLPDLMVLTEELIAVLRGRRGTITQDMPPPQLIVEVVSPGKSNEDRDYRYKRSEYAARGVAEYWIVDSQKAQVTVLFLTDGLYEESVYRGSDRIISSTFPSLTLTAAQVIQPD
jgi:Uma2 family endonuclease